MVDYDLTPEIPQQAHDIMADHPDDPLSEWNHITADGYDRSDDLTPLIDEAASNNELLELPPGEYEMDSRAAHLSGIGGIVGAGSDDTRIYFVGTVSDNDALFHWRGTDIVFHDLTVDISEDPSGDVSSDAGFMKLRASNAAWLDDVVFEGQRARHQIIDGSLETVGDRFTFQIEAGESNATVHVRNCHLPDGGTDMQEEYGSTVGHAIGPNADPPHVGYSVWERCSCSGFQDNGFYMGNTPDGVNVLIDCEAINNSASNFRPGNNDLVIGGYSEQTDTPAGRHGTCCEVDSPSDASGPAETTNATIIGLEMYAREDHYGNEAIQLRQNIGDVVFDRCTLDVDGVNRLVRADSDGLGEPHFQDCFFWLRGTSGAAFRVENSDTTADNLRILHEDGDEVDVRSSGTFELDGTSYSTGTYTASELGMSDPRPLPEFHFGEPDYEEMDVVFEILDSETGEPIEDAGVDLERVGDT